MPDRLANRCADLIDELTKQYSLLKECEQHQIVALTAIERHRHKDEAEQCKRRIGEIEQEMVQHKCSDLQQARITSRIQPKQIFPVDRIPVRTGLCKKFLEFTLERDIVIALGGVGSGLATFYQEFEVHLRAATAHCFPVDFNRAIFDRIYDAREDYCKTMSHHTDLISDQLCLKCMVASLAWATYHALSEEFPDADLIPDNSFDNPVKFANYYLESSGDVRGAEPAKIVEFFFRTVQGYAVKTQAAGVFVFMPWQGLGDCLKDSPSNQSSFKLGWELWESLAEFVRAQRERFAPQIRQNGGAKHGGAGHPRSQYDRVCLIIIGSYAPYAHTTLRKTLVSDCIWPIPPLSQDDIRSGLEVISPSLANDAIANRIAGTTNGIPWLVRLALTYISHIYEEDSTIPPDTVAEMALAASETALRIDEQALRSEAVNAYIEGHLPRIQQALENPESATDKQIEAAWFSPAHRRRMMYQITTSRIEAFTESGLLLFDGGIWDPVAEDYVFGHFPLVRFRPAGRLAHAAYRTATTQQTSLHERHQ